MSNTLWRADGAPRLSALITTAQPGTRRINRINRLNGHTDQFSSKHSPSSGRPNHGHPTCRPQWNYGLRFVDSRLLCRVQSEKDAVRIRQVDERAKVTVGDLSMGCPYAITPCDPLLEGLLAGDCCGNWGEPSKRRSTGWIEVQSQCKTRSMNEHHPEDLFFQLLIEEGLESENLDIPVAACPDIAHGKSYVMKTSKLGQHLWDRPLGLDDTHWRHHFITMALPRTGHPTARSWAPGWLGRSLVPAQGPPWSVAAYRLP